MSVSFNKAKRIFRLEIAIKNKHVVKEISETDWIVSEASKFLQELIKELNNG